MLQSKSKFADWRQGFEQPLERAKAEIPRISCGDAILTIETARHYSRNLAHFPDEKGTLSHLINQFTPPAITHQPRLVTMTMRCSAEQSGIQLNHDPRIYSNICLSFITTTDKVKLPVPTAKSR